MNKRRTALLAFLAVGLAVVVYFFDYKQEEKSLQKKESDFQMLKFDENQVSWFEIAKKDERIVLQKSETGWSLLEPIQDRADSGQIEDFIRSICSEKILAVAKESKALSTSDLYEYGLENPLAVFTIKNNLGQSKKISVGTLKNFEGNSFVKIDDDEKVYVASESWFPRSENKSIFYREKRLYRDPIADILSVKIVALNDQIELQRTGSSWGSVNHSDYVLDQNIIRDMIRKISESSIQDYVYDGEPSAAFVEQKGLNKKPLVHVFFATADSAWSVRVSLSESDNAVYALTDRPTRIVKLDASAWEFLGNLSLDSLRDRVSLTRFNLAQVSKVYVKYKKSELNFELNKGTWKLVGNLGAQTPEAFDSQQFRQLLKKIHDLEISEFIDKKHLGQFRGQDMVILKSSENNLIYQLNWGPDFSLKKGGKEKHYYYARTQISSSIFAIEKDRIDQVGLESLFDQILNKGKESRSEKNH